MTTNPQPLVFNFDLAVYRLSAIKKAAYRFLADYGVEIRTTSESNVQVVLTPRAAVSSSYKMLDSFPNEVLDQDLREVIAEETKSIRDLIMVQTFSGLTLTDSVGEDADYRDDPLGILVSSSTRERPK